MKQYEHGGNIYKYGRKIIDFSSNINPIGMPEDIDKLIVLRCLSRYPDINYTKLKNAIADYIGCKTDNVIVGNGADEIIYLFVRALGIKRPLIPSPSFSEYERAAVLSGGIPVYYKIEEDNRYIIDINKMIRNMKGVDGLMLGNPNNPTGQALLASEIRVLLKIALEMDIPVMIDEAFIEFINDYKMYESIDLINEFPNLFIVRAATKFYGMPGLRLGYGIGYNSIVRKIEMYKEPWTVNAIADIVGREIFNEYEYMGKTRRYVAKEIEYMLAELKKIDYLTVFDTKVNFILIKLKYGNVYDLKDKLLVNGILIRDASNFRFLDKSYFRVAIKRHEDNLKLIKALEEIRWR